MAGAARETLQVQPINETVADKSLAQAVDTGSNLRRAIKRPKTSPEKRPGNAVRTTLGGLPSCRRLSRSAGLICSGDASTGHQTVSEEDDELDVSSGSTASTRRSHEDQPEGRHLTNPSADRSGCLKILTQEKSLELNHGKTTLASSSTESTNGSIKSVSWSTIEILTHELILGDNPADTVGPPLSIGWELWGKQILALEDYEAHRPERRPSFSLRVPRGERERLLMHEFGFARSQIKEVTEHMNKIKMYRRVNARKTLLEALKDYFNSRRRVMGRCVREKP